MRVLHQAAHDINYDIGFAVDVGAVEVVILKPLDPANLEMGYMGHCLKIAETRVDGVGMGGCSLEVTLPLVERVHEG